MLAELTGVEGSVRMLRTATCASAAPPRFSRFMTRRSASPERLRYVIDRTHETARCLGVERPKIAVAATRSACQRERPVRSQDIDVSEPTIVSAAADRLNIVGPAPGDAVFVKLRAGRYDAVIAMYHDQGHILVNLLGFDVDPATGRCQKLSGANITLWLPIIRTSVRTAFDIAGKCVANERSLTEAIEYAERHAANTMRA